MFAVCKFKHFIGYKYLMVDLDLIILFPSYPGITANWVFNRLIRIPLSTTIFLEIPKHSVLSTRLSVQSAMYANIIYPGELFHTFTFITFINIRNNNRLKLFLSATQLQVKGSAFTSHICVRTKISLVYILSLPAHEM